MLDHGHMFISGGVVNGIHIPGTQQFDLALLVAHRAKNRHQSNRQRLTADPLLQLTVNGVKIEFAMLEQQQSFRA